VNVVYLCFISSTHKYVDLTNKRIYETNGQVQRST